MPITVDQAAQKIHSLVSDDGFFGTSRNDHMHEINKLLKQFSASDVDAIVGKLSDGDLKGWASDINSGGIFGAQGLSGDEKRDLFNEMAQDLDGTQLARLSSVFSGRDEALALSDAVATFAPSASKLDYVKAMAGRATDRDMTMDNGFGYNSLITGDKDALAVGKVLASMKSDPTSFDAAVNSLDADQLAAVLKAGEGERVTTYAGSGMGGALPNASTTFDPSVLRGMLDAAAHSGSAQTKARIFGAATGTLKNIRDSDSLLSPNPGAGDTAAKVAEGMTAIMNSDTRGIVDALNTQDASGKALTRYLSEVLTENPTSSNPVLGRQIVQLQGAGSASNASAFINTPENQGGKDFYRNAQNLGYYAGATEAAINKMNADDKTKADILTNAFSTVLSVATTAVTKLPVSGKVVSGLANGLSKELIREVTADVAAGRKSLRDALYDLALPRASANADRYRGPADPFFQSAANTVILNNQ